MYRFESLFLRSEHISESSHEKGKTWNENLVLKYGKRREQEWQCVCHSGRTLQSDTHQYERQGKEGFLDFMQEDVEKALRGKEMPTTGILYYDVPDLAMVPCS